MKQRLLIATLVAAVGVLLLGVISLGQGTFRIARHTVDGGGGVSQGGTFIVRGTIGQPDAGVLRGDSYTLAGGFWGGRRAGPIEYAVYLPLVVRNMGAQ